MVKITIGTTIKGMAAWYGFHLIVIVTTLLLLLIEPAALSLICILLPPLTMWVFKAMIAHKGFYKLVDMICKNFDKENAVCVACKINHTEHTRQHFSCYEQEADIDGVKVN